jgi:uncharacterized protein
MMKLSRWVIDVPWNDQTILFSTLTGSTIIVDNSLAEFIRREPVMTDFDPLLRDANILIDDDVSDEDLFKASLWKQKTDRSAAAPTILTTYNCNFTCAYCIERGTVPETRPTMSAAVAAQVSQWIAALTRKQGYRNLDLAWYGGEPLLAVERAIEINEGLAHLSGGVGITNFIETNGYLLEDRLQLLTALPNLFIQVTLDGPPAIHDARRPHASGQPTFDRVLQGIQAALRMFQVGVIVSVDRHNLPGVKDLLRILGTLKHKENLMVWFGFIKQTLSGLPHCASHALTIPEVSQVYVELIKHGLDSGLKVTNSIAIGLCNAESFATPVIDPTGRIYSCVSVVGDESHKVGTVFDTSTDFYIARKSQYVALERWNAECWKCPYLPLCRGGCRYESLVRFGDERLATCKKPIFERAYPELIRLRVAQGKTPVGGRTPVASATH